MSLAGALPEDLGKIDLHPSEMMFWMYLPISLPNQYEYHLPDNLRSFGEIVSAVKDHSPSAFFLRYVYLTVKTLWVSGDYIGNRPGWHIDGYGTDDLNFIWCDRAPTDFLHLGSLIDLSSDCDQSMVEMEELGRSNAHFNYPDRHLLRLDNTVIHRSPVDFAPGMRSFVKVSLSKDRYNLRGNSVNHLIPETTEWVMEERREERNHPFREGS